MKVFPSSNAKRLMGIPLSGLPSNGQVLTYNSINKSWGPAATTNTADAVTGATNLTTANAVMLVSSAGVAKQAAGLSYNSGILAASGAVSTAFGVDRPAGNFAGVGLFRSTLQRWGIYEDSTAESGSNVGSDFSIFRYDDTGAFLGRNFTLTRSTGNATFSGTVSASNGQLLGGTATTSGRIMTATGSGTVGEQSGLTWNGGVLTATGAFKSVASGAQFVAQVDNDANGFSYQFKNSSGAIMFQIGGGLKLRLDELAFLRGTTSLMYMSNGNSIGLGPGNTSPSGTVHMTDATPTTGALRVYLRKGAADTSSTNTFDSDASANFSGNGTFGGRVTLGDRLILASGKQIQVTGSESNTGFQIIGADGSANYIGTMGANEPLAIRTGSTERMRIFSSGNVAIGTATDDGTNKLQVAGSGAMYGATIYNSTPTTGSTTLTVRAGGAQGTNKLLNVVDNSGASIASIGSDGALVAGTSSVSQAASFITSNGSLFGWNDASFIVWNIRSQSGKGAALVFTENSVSDRWSIFTKPTDNTLYFGTGHASASTTRAALTLAGVFAFGASLDIGLARNAAGILEVNNGTAGTFAALKASNGTFSGRLLQSSTYSVPRVETGTAAPSSTPDSVGDIYVNTTGNKFYYAKGTSSSSDWVALN